MNSAQSEGKRVGCTTCSDLNLDIHVVMKVYLLTKRAQVISQFVDMIYNFHIWRHMVQHDSVYNFAPSPLIVRGSTTSPYDLK